jgi:hypothetical protein
MLPDDADAGALAQAAELLWQGWRSWDAGTRLYVILEDAAARVISPDYRAAGWRFAAPPACYVQLPYQRFWARVSEASAYEPVDGCFLSVRESGPGAHELSVLAVLGLRRERPGVSLIVLRDTIADADVRARLDEPWREGAAPFANAIPGGELMGYQTVASASELEALVLRVLRELDVNSPSLVAAPGTSGEGESALPHVLVP